MIKILFNNPYAMQNHTALKGFINGKFIVHNCGYFSVITENFKIATVATNSVHCITSNYIISPKKLFPSHLIDKA
ncbi:MAG: hypothetical protein KID00_11770 [Clostridium argentinense]|uniref:Uncharacterized protein n=1 Tax=Clostridium faecium TaxID=2762223 RepID=A0ABR8YX06_9CLOT|nr:MULTISPECIES: hypothetical protein [Clostridium]MBD8048812.1 hypothetical protein [Clostridium faecium]MBS5824506.1 hypothetical protein [Clostridium argentinense]MDU1348343.1 hypothetical protein [Clostridium argentinense]